jgi:uncharacterized repeat protein (TIGR01451 family)
MGLGFLASALLGGMQAEAQNWPQISFSKPTPGFTHPSHLASAWDGSGRLFVVEQAGRVRIIKNGVLLSMPFLDITTRVGSTTAGTGLVSIAFPPDFASKGHFYVNYTTSLRYLIVARYTVSSDPDVANASSEEVVLTDGPYPGHYGGELAFGPLDGYLYLGIGTGTATMPDALGQDLTSLHGKLIRIDVEAGNPTTYTIPLSNPFVSTPSARGEIWALGLRNPFRSSFDRATGDFYIADVGQSTLEEVDFEPAGSQGGANYGWNIMEGSDCFNATSCNSGGLTIPATEYDHSQGCSVSGGTVYRGTRYPTLQGIYFFGDWCSGRIWGLQYTNSSWQSSLLSQTTLSIVSFAQDESGKLWVADYDGGAIYPIKEGPSNTIDLSLTQSDSPDPCPAGSRLTYSVVVRNNSSSLATGVVVSDTMPNRASFVSVSATAGKCVRSGSNVTWGIPSLAAGSSATMTLVVQPQAEGTISNVVNVVANEPDVDSTNNSSTESTTIIHGADLKVTVSDGKTSIAAGSQNTYTITVTNLGPGAVTGATIQDTFPSKFTGATFTASQTGGATGFSASGIGNVHDTVNMPVASKIIYQAKGKLSSNATGAVVDTATVAVPVGISDPNSANNTSTDSDTIVLKADLKVTVNDGKAAAIAGTKDTYTLVITNAGPSNVTGAVIQDTFPVTFTGLNFTATQTGGATGFTATGTGDINDRANMPAGSKITYKVTGTISASATGSISDTASVTSNVTDPNTANNTATDTDTL